MAPKGGIKKSDNPFLVFRESQYASRNFKFGQGAQFAGNAIVPRPKFLFFARFNISKSGLASNLPEGRDTPAYSNIKDGIIFQIKQIDKPKFNLQTETMHQYNKKRIVQTKIDFNPMTINFHDDIGDRVLKFWADYFLYYYGDGGRKSTTDWKNDIVERNFYYGQFDGWGYRGQFNGGVSNMHFLDSIELLQFYGREFTSIKFVNPMITIFDHDNNDYAEGREGTGIRISFDYEGVIYNLDPEPVDGREDEFGFVSDYFEPPSPVPVSGTENATKESRKTDVFVNPDPRPTNRSDGRQRLQALRKNRISGLPASMSVLGSNTTFGAISSTVTSSLVNLITASGLSPSPDIIEKSTGVKNVINNFGESIDRTISGILVNANRPLNSGIDSLRVSQAAAIINTTQTSNEQIVGPGQTKISSISNANEFSNSLGTAAALAVNEGFAASVATFTNEITSSSASENSIVNKLPNGKYQVTTIGATIMNSMRSASSAIGVKKLPVQGPSPTTQSNNNRLLDAEQSNPDTVPL